MSSGERVERRGWAAWLAIGIVSFSLFAARVANAEGFGPEAAWTTGFCVTGELCATADVSGDGRDDVIRFKTNGDVYVATSTGTSFATPALWLAGAAPPSKKPRLGDFNGDGLDDVVIFDTTNIKVALSDIGRNFATPVQWYASNPNYPEIEIGDVDNDGDDDIVGFSKGAGGTVAVLKATAGAFSAPAAATGGFCFQSEVPKVGDVNNDNRADIVCFQHQTPVTGTKVWVALATGTTALFNPRAQWHDNFSAPAETPALGDINNDNKADLVTFVRQGTRDVVTATSTGALPFNGAVLAHDNSFCGDTNTCMTGDFNGDNKADLVAFIVTVDGAKAAGEVWVSLRQPCGVFDPVGMACGNGLWCDGDEFCQANKSCVASTSPQNDSNACTIDACVESTHVVTHTPLNPDDANNCTVDWCDTTTGRQNVPAMAGVSCGNGNVCDGLDLCDGAGHCQSSSSPGINDNNSCSTDACSPTGGITHTFLADGTACGDGLGCNGADLCSAGACVTSAPPTGPKCYDCNNGPGGTVEWTRASVAGTSCNDNNVCTTSDQCNGSGTCGGTPVAAQTSCDDANACNGPDVCNGSGVCTSGPAPSLDDGNSCTDDVCTPANGIKHNPKSLNTACVVGGVTKYCDGAGRCILPTNTTTAAPTPAPDALPTDVAPEFADSIDFLYTGPGAIQKQAGGAGAVLIATQVGVVRGRVLGRDNGTVSGAGAELPLPKVTVRVAGTGNQVQGETLTREDGVFDIAVNAGKVVTLEFEKSGYLIGQRTFYVPQHDYLVTEDMVLVQPSTVATTFLLNPFSSGPHISVVGEPVTDASSPPATPRKGRLLVPAGTGATITWNDNSTTSSSEQINLVVGITEYTVGTNGPRSMPGNLPTTSGYTYAMELSAKRAADLMPAKTINFTQPLVYYVENFLDFKIGSKVPTGYYDRALQAWKNNDVPGPAGNGRVIKIVNYDVGTGAANVDIDSEYTFPCTAGACPSGSGLVCTAGMCVGDAAVEDAATLQTQLGMTLAERQALALAYPIAGTEVWRTPVTHFSPWDHNWPYGPDPCASGGPCDDDDDGDDDDDDDDDKKTDKPKKPCKKNGSIIGCENGVLGETLPIAGSSFSLNYRSSTFPEGALRFRLPGTAKSKRKRFEARLFVAGREVAFNTFSPTSNGQSVSVYWDGLDAYGRLPLGQVTARLVVDEFYASVYYPGDTFWTIPFNPTPLSTTQAASNRTEFLVRREWKRKLTGRSGSTAWYGLGGWMLSSVHRYDPDAQTLYLGDGTVRDDNDYRNLTRNFATTSKPTGAIASAPDGSIYLSAVDASSNHLVLKVASNGVVTTFAGSTGWGFLDNLPATSGKLNNPRGVAVDKDGTVYIADSTNQRIRKVTGNFISTVVGDGNTGVSDGPLSLAKLNDPRGVAVAEDGTIYIADTGNGRIRAIDPARTTITTVAGNGANFTCTNLASYDGVLANTVPIGSTYAVAVGPNGRVYFGSGAITGASLVWEIGPDGKLHRIAGLGCTNPAADPMDGGQSRNANLWNVQQISVASDGGIYLADQQQARVRRIDTDGTIRTVAGNGLWTVGVPETNVSPTATWFNPLIGAAILADNNLAVIQGTGTFNGTLRKVTPALPERPTTGGITIANGNESLEFDLAGHHLETRDLRTGATLLTVQRDGSGRITSVTQKNPVAGGVDRVTTVERDASGNPLRIVSPFGQKTELALQNGRLTTVTYPVNSDGIGGNDVVTLEYAGGNELLTKLVDARGGSHLFKYDAYGVLMEDHDPVGGVQLLSQAPTQPATGYKVQHQSPGGLLTSYSIEPVPSGLVTRKVVEPDGSTATLTRDLLGVTTLTRSDGTSVTTKQTADPLNGMQAAFDSEETTTSGGKTRTILRGRSPLPAGSMTETTKIDLPSGTDPVYTSVYNFATRVNTTTSPEGRTITETFDLAGRLKTLARPGLNDIAYNYDTLGRPSTIVQGTRTQTTAYYPTTTNPESGYPFTVTNPLSQVTTIVPDALGRLRERTMGGLTTKTEWDASSNLKKVITASNIAHNMAYTGADLLSSYIAPSVGTGTTTTTYESTLDRNPSQQIRPSGLLLTHLYDAQGRIDLTQSAFGNLDYSYWQLNPPAGGSAGRLKQLIGPGIGASAAVTLDFQYFGFLPKSVAWSGAVSGSVAWDYDGAFRPTTETVTPGGTSPTVTFGYDNDGLVTCASPSTCVPTGPNALTLSYNAPDPVTTKNGLLRQVSVTGTSALNEVLTYSAYGELASQTATFGATALMSITYDTAQDPRDSLGRILKKTEVINGQTTTWVYSYDAVGRLEKVWKNALPPANPLWQYAYDNNGNRLKVDGVNTIATYDAQDRMLTYAGSTYTYGADGELQTKTTGSSVTTFVYDGYGDLRAVTTPAGKTIEYLVDGMGRRVGKKENGVLKRRWIYKDELEPVAEIDDTGAVTRFVYASRRNVPDLMIRSDGVYRILCDQLGSVRLVVKLDGTIAQRIDYDAWGDAVISPLGSENLQPFGFAGGLVDSDTKLVRFGARDYDPTIGRWASKDPLAFDASGTNFYAYAVNDSVNIVDLDGQMPLAAGASIIIDGAAAGGAALGAGVVVVAVVGGVRYLDLWIQCLRHAKACRERNKQAEKCPNPYRQRPPVNCGLCQAICNSNAMSIWGQIKSIANPSDYDPWPSLAECVY